MFVWFKAPGLQGGLAGGAEGTQVVVSWLRRDSLRSAGFVPAQPGLAHVHLPRSRTATWTVISLHHGHRSDYQRCNACLGLAWRLEPFVRFLLSPSPLGLCHGLLASWQYIVTRRAHPTRSQSRIYIFYLRIILQPGHSARLLHETSMM